MNKRDMENTEDRDIGNNNIAWLWNVVCITDVSGKHLMLRNMKWSS